MLSFSEIIELKHCLQKNYQVQLHYHDVCPKPFFTLNKNNEEIADFIGSILNKSNHIDIFLFVNNSVSGNLNKSFFN